jgi:hypothetical protein
MNTLGDDESIISTSLLKDDYEYPEWYNRKKYEFYKKIYKRLKTLIHIHNDSSNYYAKMDKYIFGPSIFISCISGIASFMSTTDLVAENTQSIFGISVGVLSSVATLLQSLGSAYRFSAKEESHRHAAEEYNKLGVKIRFEIEMPNEEDFTDKLEMEILDIQNKCRYFAPQFIIEKYNKKQEKKEKENEADHEHHQNKSRRNTRIFNQINTSPTVFIDDENNESNQDSNNTLIPSSEQEENENLIQSIV